MLRRMSDTHDSPHQAPILSLDDARRLRAARGEPPADAAERERKARRLRLLQRLLLQRRLRASALSDMLRLGLVTDEIELLPCRWSGDCGCPLLARTVPRSPCAEALRRHGRADPADPVVRQELYPCVLLGQELYPLIMLPVWLRQQE